MIELFKSLGLKSDHLRHLQMWISFTRQQNIDSALRVRAICWAVEVYQSFEVVSGLARLLLVVNLLFKDESDTRNFMQSAS